METQQNICSTPISEAPHSFHSHHYITFLLWHFTTVNTRSLNLVLVAVIQIWWSTTHSYFRVRSYWSSCWHFFLQEWRREGMCFSVSCCQCSYSSMFMKGVSLSSCPARKCHLKNFSLSVTFWWNDVVTTAPVFVTVSMVLCTHWNVIKCWHFLLPGSLSLRFQRLVAVQLHHNSKRKGAVIKRPTTKCNQQLFCQRNI